MTRTNKLLLQAAVVSCFAFSGLATSADNCSGTYTVVGNVGDKQDLGNGITLTTFQSHSSNQWNETGEVRVGTCSGYFLTMADGKARMVYACARKNKDGDTVVDEGSLEPGADRGSWKVTHATGKLAKMLGDSGWWKAVADNGKVTIGVWGGTCK
jgi:hypothetical protein